MRFPRIKKIRLESVDGDEKKASEATTDEEVWKIFDEARSKRLDLDSMIGTQSQSGIPSMRLRRGCRFLTPEEFRKKAKKRKIKIIDPPARKVPKVEICESKLLEGLSFCVLEGVYSLDANCFDAREAQEGGWEQKVLKVKSEEDVIEFIKKHGGTYTAKVIGVPKEYIIGGNKDDARVKTQIVGLKHAKSLVDSKKKADKSLASVARYHDGIVKWTYVYSLVHRLQEEAKKPFSERSNDSCFVPEPHQYLARISNDESVEEALFSLNRPISVDEMEHVLTTPFVTDTSRWQLQDSIDLPKEDRWVLSSKFTFLWPYNNDSHDTEVFNERDTVVVYPDVFSCGFGFSAEKDSSDGVKSDTRSTRWDHVESYSDEIMSILPLISSMGGLITPHLHSGVTHIVCLLKSDIEIPFEAGKSLDIFASKERGRFLIDYLSHRFPENKKIRLVSPNWFRKKMR